jgi:RNA exonuclease 4
MYYRQGKQRANSLKQLAKQQLGIDIQTGSHSSVDDARTAMALYFLYAGLWETALTTPKKWKKLKYCRWPKRLDKEALSKATVKQLRLGS